MVMLVLPPYPRSENGVTLIYEKKRESFQTSESLRVIYGVGTVYPDGVVAPGFARAADIVRMLDQAAAAVP